VHDTLVTLQGNLGADVRFHETAKGPVAHFRVGARPSWFDRQANAWVDGETTWYSVTAWRGLARNCAESLRRGDPVVVQGRLTHREWSANGSHGVDLEVHASFVGHDLNRGTSTFSKAAPAAAAAPGAASGEDRTDDGAGAEVSAGAAA
jgi:single-strand DNA-binding protein